MKKLYQHIVTDFKTIMFTFVMLILILSFGLWGVADVVRSLLYSQTSAVEINGEKLSTRLIDSNFRKFLYMVGNNNNTTISLEDGVNAGLLNQSVLRLTSEIALNEEAREMGIEINDDLVATQIRNDKYFQDDNGNFDKDKFERVISYSGYANEKQFLSQIKSEKARIDLLTVIKSGVQPLKELEVLLQKYDKEIRSAKYIILPFDTDSIDTSDKNLKKYYEANSDNYKTAELKDISVLMLAKANIPSDGLTAEELEDELLSQVDLVDTLLTEELDLEDISAEVGIDLIKVSDVDPMMREDLNNDKLSGIREIVGTVMEMGYDKDNISQTSTLKETTDGDYFVVRIDATKGNETKPFSEVKEDIRKKYIKTTSEENGRKEAVELVKDINSGKTTLKEVANRHDKKVKQSMMFHRRPEIKELQALSPIAIAQLFTKENIGEAGLSITSDGVFLFVLDKIDYEERTDKDKAPIGNNQKTQAEYSMIESFSNALLEKYGAEINYNALDKMYDIEQDTTEEELETEEETPLVGKMN